MKTVINDAAKDREKRSFVFWTKVLKRLFLSVLLGCAITALGIVVDGLSDSVEASDVAVILGSKVDPSGIPSARLAARLNRGIELFRAGMAKYLIVSGGVGTERMNEALVMRDYLARQGIPKDKIITDESGYNTDDTARNCKAIMVAHGFKSVIVVTQYFHVTRTRMALRLHGVQEVRSSHARYFELRDIYSTLREIVAVPVYWIRKR